MGPVGKEVFRFTKDVRALQAELSVTSIVFYSVDSSASARCLVVMAEWL